jgi:MshEN domain
MLPEELTLKRLILPFDVMSRTVMIAMANPFDAAGKEAAQGLLDYNIQWHVASPQAIIKILTQAFRIGAAGSATLESESAFSKSTEAPIFGEIPVSLPFPELKVSPSNTSLPGSSDSGNRSPLPDTSDFRLKK